MNDDLTQLVNTLMGLVFIVFIVCAVYYIFGSLFSWLCGAPLWVGVIIAIIIFSHSSNENSD